jgi:hypothetical protein
MRNQNSDPTHLLRSRFAFKLWKFMIRMQSWCDMPTWPHVSNICDWNSQTGLDELLPSAYLGATLANARKCAFWMDQSSSGRWDQPFHTDRQSQFSEHKGLKMTSGPFSKKSENSESDLGVRSHNKLHSRYGFLVSALNNSSARPID